jgi:hypothetical protein
VSYETVITGKIRWTGNGEGVTGAIVSIYTLMPPAMVGRAEADDEGQFWMKTGVQWTTSADLYVVVLDSRGELLRVVREDPSWLTGTHTRLDVAVTGRWRPTGPRRTGQRQQKSSDMDSEAPRRPALPADVVQPTKCIVPTSFWPPVFVGGGRGTRLILTPTL